MYINPFVAGILATLFIEVVFIGIMSVIAYKKNHKEDK
jgi:hypothetical protein